MTGYQEVLTDPSYKGQIVVFTYPLIGNYGINEKDLESKIPQVKAVAVYEACEHFSHHEAVSSLREYLNKWNIPLLTEVDTRAVVKTIRSGGTMNVSCVNNRRNSGKDPEQKTRRSWRSLKTSRQWGMETGILR